jgi:hypothetical protein
MKQAFLTGSRARSFLLASGLLTSLLSAQPLAGCGADTGPTLPPANPGDGDSSSSDAGGNADPGDGTGNDNGPGNGDGDGEAPGKPDAGGGEAPGDGDDAENGDATPLRFVVLGDGGTGDDVQKKVAAAMKSVCDQRGCKFALYLGDNIYENGAATADDALFKSNFEDPYAALDFPFYVALGNHDYGSTGTNVLPENKKSAAQVEYTAHSDKWNLPNYYYTFRDGPVAFFVIDTNSVVLPEQLPAGAFNTPPAPADEQQAWLDGEMAKSDARWKIVFGHHPYLSNGEHGNAGDYSVLLEAKGTRLKALFEQSICGKAQLYFSGHDHDREWLEPACGTQFIVSGAAAKLREMPGHGTASRWGDATKNGFLWVEIAGDLMTGVFYDEDGAVNYEDSVSL